MAKKVKKKETELEKYKRLYKKALAKIRKLQDENIRSALQINSQEWDDACNYRGRHRY